MSLYTYLYKGLVYDTVTVDNASSAVNSSVFVTTVVVSPPAPKAEIPDPAFIVSYLAVDKSFTSDQELPFQTSAFATLPGGA